MTLRRCRVAVFASGRGSNLQALLQYGQSHPDWPVEIALAFSDRPDCRALEIARSFDVPAVGLRPRDFTDKPAFEATVVDLLRKNRVQGIALAGYMRILGPTLLSAYPDRIVNIHPSLLPLFPGKQAVADALVAGVAETGVTIHWVDAGVDTGSIIRQQRVAITEGMTEEALLERIHAVEHSLYPVVLGEVALQWL